jgi:hypothetical protein
MFSGGGCGLFEDCPSIRTERSSELLFNQNVTFRVIQLILGGIYSTYSRKMKCGHKTVSRAARKETIGQIGA